MKIGRLITELYLFAFFWVFFAVAWFFRDSDYRYFYSALGMGYALVLLLLSLFIAKRRFWAWRMTTFLVGLGILVSIFDQIGWIDVIYLFFTSIVFISLVKGKPLMQRGDSESDRDIGSRIGHYVRSGQR